MIYISKKFPNKISKFSLCDPMHIQKILISKTLLEELSALSKSRYPEESCAVLFGNIKHNSFLSYVVTKISKLNNMTHSSVEFRFDEMELYTHWRENKKVGLSLLGIFHSHPDDAYISRYDKIVILNTGKLYPELVWVVYGNQSHLFKAFILYQTRQIKEIPIM
jgi:proteasome lid subunit RPN8/RPN11